MTALRADTFPEQAVRERARTGAAAAFPPLSDYGGALLGEPEASSPGDALDATRLVPPVFMPRRLEKLIDLAREPLHGDVGLETTVGGFAARLPLYLSAFGSTRAVGTDLGRAAAAQAGALGIPMVVGENVVPVDGYTGERSLLARISAYAGHVPDGVGGVVVQQSTEDADAEVWNRVYSDPATRPLLESGRLGFELKVGQGAKPGIGGLTVVDRVQADRLADQFALEPLIDPAGDRVLRCASPGTFTEEILRQQVRLMRNNYPRARVWVKLPPGRDVAAAADVAWQAGADAVTVDGAEGGTGWAPTASLAGVGLPLAECLRRIGSPRGCLLVSGRVWEGLRAVKCLAAGATATGLGRAALLAVDENPGSGLIRLVEAMTLELRLLISALGKYHPAALSTEDLWSPAGWPVPAGRLVAAQG
ncbi:glutamate synthase conserved region-containing protein [Lentzea albidocapillata subsp. violacea]|uniref:Glutamate synthase conserved region-containing protein n=1 Tax=Lentzea albidocapillata subsp. violacea TaxID=128104 RepID=A0A1G8SE91_9PSEU|nr:glutamate synthase-related protein [Lentzea albidocapillata]SDJ27556.1 glutamate synthase conserved region-containing protein [Lentzea albidocapillata subsp. violacea]